MAFGVSLLAAIVWFLIDEPEIRPEPATAVPVRATKSAMQATIIDGLSFRKGMLLPEAGGVGMAKAAGASSASTSP